MKVSAARLAGAAALSILLAPAPAPAVAPTGRYTSPLTGVVHDSKTGLNWQQAVAPGTYTWTQAGTYCTTTLGTTLAGPWRLPAIKELQTLADDSVPLPGPTIDATFFPSTPASGFWSSTPVAGNGSGAWVVYFGSGNTGNDAVAVTYLVRCVR